MVLLYHNDGWSARFIFNTSVISKGVFVDDFKEGDLVAVFGGKLDKDSHTADSVTLCKVLIVGQKDLVVENSAYYSTTHHIVPKSICARMYLDPQILSSSEVLEPEIGDLVVSFSRGIEKLDKKVGVLCEVIYKLGKPEKCELLCGTETISVNWDSLVVLRRD